MVEWVAQSVWDGFAPFLKFFPITGITGAIAFINTIRAHCAPFVVIARQPDFS
jgi:hypothetical protein